MMELNENGYRELLAGEKPVLVEFHAPWCVYCRRIGPALKKVAEQHRGHRGGPHPGFVP